MSTLITRFELARLSDPELLALYRDVFHRLVQSQPHSAARRNNLASLDNLQNEINARQSRLYPLSADP